MKNNYSAFLNLLLISGIVIFFSSCARENTSISYNNEKLRKQSLEIENSRPSVNNTAKVEKMDAAIVKPEATIKDNNSVAENKTTTKPEVFGKKAEEKKLTPVQKMIAKRIAKNAEKVDQKALDANLKYAIIFGAVALIIYLFAHIAPIFWVLATVALIVAIVFLLLWVLEQ
jgi:hypothetical protein